jgi:hypothetical protein
MTWFLLAPLSIIFTLLAMMLSPLVALFVRADGYLPRWLWAFGTPDAPAIGDDQYRANQMAGVTSRWWMATCWLARNPGCGFDEFIGAHILPGFIYQSTGDELTHNTPLHNGWVYRSVTNQDGSPYWQLHAVYRLTSTKCLKVALGWKLWGELKEGETRRLCCTVSPFTKYTT